MTDQTKVIDGVSYTVRELYLRDVEDLLGKEGVNFSIELFRRAVLRDGQPIGEASGDLPLKVYTVLTKIVNKLNAPQDDEPGNE